MDLRLCVAVALFTDVALATHRDSGSYGNYGTTDSGPFWGYPVSTPSVTTPTATSPSVQRSYRSSSYSGRIRQRAPVGRGTFSQRFRSSSGPREVQQRPYFRFSSQQFQRGHSKIFVSRQLPTVTTSAPSNFGQSPSFLQMLLDRQTALRNEQDQQMIMSYLLELYRIKKLMGTDSDASLDSQIDVIDGIKNSIIKREVLKLFVKDMVEKSGLLRRNVTAKDVQALGSLIDRINVITSEINMAQQMAEMASAPDDFVDMLAAMATMQQTSNTLASFNPLSSRGSSWSVMDRSSFIPRPGDTQRLMSYAGRRRGPATQPPLRGLSIFGDFAGDRQHVMKRETTTVRPTTTEAKRSKKALPSLYSQTITNIFCTYL